MFYILRVTGVSEIRSLLLAIYNLAVKIHGPIITTQWDIGHNRNMYPEEGEINFTLRKAGEML